MLEERNVCGTKSGRDMDKIEELGFTMADSDEIDVPYIKECEMCYECSTVMVTEMEGSEFDAEVKDKVVNGGVIKHLVAAGQQLLKLLPKGGLQPVAHGTLDLCTLAD